VQPAKPAVQLHGSLTHRNAGTSTVCLPASSLHFPCIPSTAAAQAVDQGAPYLGPPAHLPVGSGPGQYRCVRPPRGRHRCRRLRSGQQLLLESCRRLGRKSAQCPRCMTAINRGLTQSSQPEGGWCWHSCLDSSIHWVCNGMVMCGDLLWLLCFQLKVGSCSREGSGLLACCGTEQQEHSTLGSNCCLPDHAYGQQPLTLQLRHIS
jgi:hypothetical protein